ncbi:MAG: hypothetical protein IKV25_03565 [Clostridia bacterium]|nr:hypothetical protein [Clostridia bacterium]
MANFFNSSKVKEGTQREIFESKYNSSIMNILLVVVFSFVNVVLLAVNSNTYFLFSAFIPYFLADYGMYFCGMYPEEYYYDMSEMVFSDKSTLIITFAIAIAILLFYLLCWFLAKKKKVGWLIAALVLFVIDTLAMFAIAGISADLIVDIVFHIWVIVSLVNGIVNYNKLKNLPEEAMEIVMTEGEEQPYFEQTQGNSDVLRMADSEVKERILLEAETPGYHIVYRRVKKTNELVVNGMVYDEYEALVEFPHTLTAVVNGHKIEVKYDETSHMYIFFDGEQLAKKIRII